MPADRLRPGGAGRSVLLFPTLIAIGLVIVVVAIAFRPVRDELRLSFVRSPTPYVELYFSDPDQQELCPSVEGELPVEFTVLSHLGSAEQLDYAVSVIGLGKKNRFDRSSTSTLSTRPEEPLDVVESLEVPSRPFQVLVQLPAYDSSLVLHCDGGRD